MKIILTSFLLLVSCSKIENDSQNSEKYFPKIGDSSVFLFQKGLTPYFMSEVRDGAQISGFLHDPVSGRFSGFGPGMIDETKPNVKTVLIMVKNQVIIDVLIRDGGVTDKMLDTGGWSEWESGSP